MELSKAQKEVILKMREGWTLESNGWNELVTDGTEQIHVRYVTTKRLQALRLVDSNKQLTDLGKTIELK